MSEKQTATLEVPKKYRVGIQGRLVDFRDDALNTLGLAEIGMSEDSPDRVAAQRDIAEAVTPLVNQGMEQIAKDVVIYKGSSEWLGWALKWQMAHVSEVLHGVMDKNVVDTEKARGMLEELDWLNDSLEGLESSIREAVAA